MSEYDVAKDDKNKSYLELDSREMDMLSYVKAQKDAGAFNKIVVVLNTANAMELGFLNDEAYGIDAAVWVGCIGDQGANAVAKVLNGTVNPSGRTVDTYVSDLTKDPTYVNFDDTFYNNIDGSIGGYESGRFNEYEEGIYVGYRYYETAAAEAMDGNYDGFNYDEAVVYPFGYGLSYTTFEKEYEGTPSYNDGTFTFNVKVTNTGDVAGKDVVEIYEESPYTKGGIEKSKVVLAGFAKTNVINPGESENVTIEVKAEDLASYDYKNNKAYVLDEGEYKFYLSDNSHSWASIDAEDSSKVYTHDFDAWVFDKDNKRSTDLVAATNQFDDVSVEFVDVPTEGKPLNFSRADFAGTFPTAPTEADMTAEDYIKTAHETVYDENTNKETGNVEGSVAYTDKMPTTKANNGIQLISLRGLDYNDPAWDLLLDELDMSTVANMLANAGYNTAELTDIGKPATLDYDGPMGWSTWVSASGKDAICLGFPAEEVLAATWNEALAEEMGQIIGEQGLYNGFNGWYAPAMNTHRNGIATWANEQAIREIYLKPFEVAPMVILVCADKDAASNFQGGNSYLMDGTIVATHMMLAATDIGLDTCWAGVNDVEQTQKVFNLQENIYPICFLDLGYRSDDFKSLLGNKKRNSLDSMINIL